MKAAFVLASAMVLLPPLAFARTAAGTRGVEEPHVIYLNFSDGTESIIAGPEDPATNRSRTCDASPFLPWRGAIGCGDRDECLRTIAGLVDELWKDFNVVVTTRRPDPAVPYSMAMIGPTSGSCLDAAGVGGIAPLDCGNRERNIAFAFRCDTSPVDCALVVSQETAHTLGLAHTDDPCDVMHPARGRCATQVSFSDRAATVSGPSCFGGTQNSHQVLKDVLGDWPAGSRRPRDWESCVAGPPTVTINRPRDGDRVDRSFTLSASVLAACPLLSVTAEIPGAGLVDASRSPPFEWQIRDLADGDYIIRVVARQASSPVQVAEAAIAIHVEPLIPCATNEVCTSPEICVEGTCRSERPPDPGGCACAVPAQAPIDAGTALAALGLAALAQLALRRRRSSRSGM